MSNEHADRPSVTHLDAIRAVMAALPAGTTLPRAILVLEDANVACRLGLTIGLDLETVQRNVVEILRENGPSSP